MGKIFDAHNLERMRVSAGFRWRTDDTFITEGITPNLTAQMYTEWLDSIITNIIERR